MADKLTTRLNRRGSPWKLPPEELKKRQKESKKRRAEKKKERLAEKSQQIGPQAVKTGRKNTWESKIEPNLEQIAAWFYEGTTQKEVIARLRISESAWYKCVKQREELREAMTPGIDFTNKRVEQSFIKKCMGYFVTETETIAEVVQDVEPDENGKYKRKVSVKTIKKKKKYITPTDTALIFYLTNQLPAFWKHNQEFGADIADVIKKELKGKDEMKVLAEALEIIKKVQPPMQQIEEAKFTDNPDSTAGPTSK